MILDYSTEFTAAGGKAVTSQSAEIQANTLHSDQAKDWGAGELVKPYIRVTTANAAKLTSLDVFIKAADDASGTNAVTLSTVNILKAALTKNALIYLPPLPPGTSKKELIAVLTVNGTAEDAGTKVIVGLTAGIDGTPQNGVNSI
jgi:hypothetical protein